MFFNLKFNFTPPYDIIPTRFQTAEASHLPIRRQPETSPTPFQPTKAWSAISLTSVNTSSTSHNKDKTNPSISGHDAGRTSRRPLPPPGSVLRHRPSQTQFYRQFPWIRSSLGADASLVGGSGSKRWSELAAEGGDQVPEPGSGAGERSLRSSRPWTLHRRGGRPDSLLERRGLVRFRLYLSQQVNFWALAPVYPYRNIFSDSIPQDWFKTEFYTHCFKHVCTEWCRINVINLTDRISSVRAGGTPFSAHFRPHDRNHRYCPILGHHHGIFDPPLYKSIRWLVNMSTFFWFTSITSSQINN